MPNYRKWRRLIFAHLKRVASTFVSRWYGRPRPVFAPAQVYFINLDQRPDRRAFIETQLQGMGIPVTRWPAIWLTDLNGEPRHSGILERGIASYVQKSGFAMGTVGCYLSHVTLLQHIASGSNAQCLVMEDDVTIDDGFQEAARRLVERLPPFDLVLFDCVGDRHEPDRVEEYIYRPTRSFPYYYGAFATLIAAGRAQHILDVLACKPILDIDGLYLTLRDIRCYVVYTGKTRPASFGSDRCLVR